MTEESTPWWDGFYHDLLAEILLERDDPQDLENTSQFLWEHLGLKPGQTVFDQCCGIGNVSMALSKRGLRGVGVDLSDIYIKRANEATQKYKLKCQYFCDDAFNFTPSEPCDAAFNWYSSFGYADSDAQNSEMLQRAYEALKPGGRFALEGPNMVGVLRYFKPTMLKRKNIEGIGEVLLVRESELTMDSGQLKQLWTYILPSGERREYRSALRLYLPHQIAEMMRACGFEEPQMFAGVDGAPLTTDSMRCIITAQRAS